MLRVCLWNPRPAGTQAHPGRNIDGSALADLDCHPHIRQEHLTGWSGNLTEDVLEGVHAHLGTKGCTGPQQTGRIREFLVGDLGG